MKIFLALCFLLPGLASANCKQQLEKAAAPNVKRIYLFRHGETEWNANGRFQGHTDIPLNDVGREQAKTLGQNLVAHGLQLVVSSDLSRAFETGKIVADATGIPIFMDAGLRESNLGESEGMTRDEVVAKYGEEQQNRWRSPLEADLDVRFPGGESGREVQARAFQTMERLLRTRAESKIGIAAHSGVVRRVMQKLLPADRMPEKIPNTYVIVLTFDMDTGAWGVE